MSERSLAFFGTDTLIGSQNNGNFLGIVELLSKYDPIIAEHVSKVRSAQVNNQKMHINYMSTKIQNEFIDICGSFVQRAIIDEVQNAKYFSIIADSTPDSSHIEQTALIIRYLKVNEIEFLIEERFICFDNFSDKTGQEIANRLLELLIDLKLDFKNCVGQSYDYGANMAGKTNGVQAVLLRKNKNCFFSGCGNHTLNLIGVHSAECCNDAITYFGVVQQIYNFFSASPRRWEVLKKHLGNYSLHNISKTRWSARLDSVKPIALHLKSLINALKEIDSKYLPADAKIQIPILQKYLSKFEFIIMSTIWLKVLTLIHQTNLIIESRKATLDVEQDNIKNLIESIQQVKNDWELILNESIKRAEENEINPEFETNRRLKNQKEAEQYFRVHVFHEIVNSILKGLSQRFQSIFSVCNTFAVLWKFDKLENEEIIKQGKVLQEKYENELSLEILDELVLLKKIYKSNFTLTTKPNELLKEILDLGFWNLLPNIATAIRIFLTLPVSVSEAERSFSTLKKIKNVLRSTMSQKRLNSLATLHINYDLARILNFRDIISEFANVKARNATI